MSLLLLALACGPSDRELYLQAMEAEGDEASALCARIEDDGLRGECQVHEAAGLARTGQVDTALARCDLVAHGAWREECWFLVVDEAALEGERARELCRHTGRFRAHCLGHAIGREVQGVEAAHGQVGQELELREAIDAVVLRYKPGAPEGQRAVTAETLMARILASREAEQPFDRSRCGVASVELCARAYRTSLDGTPREVDLEGLCQVTRTPELVSATGARAWAPASADLASEVWSHLCDDLASGRFVRDPLGVPAPPPQEASIPAAN